MEKIDGNAQLLLSPEESDLFGRQARASASASVSKMDADYQNDPKGDEQCSECAMFVPGLPDDSGGYCTKVFSIRGPTGMIFQDGWCKFFDAAGVAPTDPRYPQYEKALAEIEEAAIPEVAPPRG